MPEGVKSAAASVARNINKVLNAVGAGPSPTLDFYGHPFSHPLVEEYFSQCPVRFGDHVAKIGAFPVAAEQKALTDWQLDPHQDEGGFRHAAVDYFEGNDAVFELRAQLWTDAETQPIEDTSVDWPTSESPLSHRRHDPTAAAVSLWSRPRPLLRRGDDVRPAHSLEVHRPLGGVMRARMQVYQALSDFRHRENGIAAANTATIQDIPA